MTESINKIEIGQRIRRLRISNDFTQSEFAEEIDISINFLSEVENGKKGLSQETLARICQSTHTSADFILFGETQKQLSLIDIANSLSTEELQTTLTYIQALIEMRKINH